MRELAAIRSPEPVLSGWLALFRIGRFRGAFNATAYWNSRYRNGGGSGLGSRGLLARAKAQLINRHIRDHAIGSVLDLGVGDGWQLRLLDVASYIGVDISSIAIARLEARYASDASKRFVLHRGGSLHTDPSLRAELGLSLDVIYHLVDDADFERHLDDLFRCSLRHVIIFSSNCARRKWFARHVRHRRFTPIVRERFPEWKLMAAHPGPLGAFGTSAFFIYHRTVPAPGLAAQPLRQASGFGSRS